MKNIFKVMAMSFGLVAMMAMFSCSGGGDAKKIVGKWECVSFNEGSKWEADHPEEYNITLNDDNTYTCPNKNKHKGKWELTEDNKLKLDGGYVESDMKNWTVSINSDDEIQLSCTDEDFKVKLKRIK